VIGSLILIPWPETVWTAAGRIAGRTPLPLTEVGQKRAREWAVRLSSGRLSPVYSGTETASLETARVIADYCRARRKPMEALAEVDSGLWDGLTVTELKRRYPKVFKRWYDDPSSVCPPEGEDVVDAATRLQGALERVGRRLAGRQVALVTGPVALGIVRCLLEDVALNRLRGMLPGEPVRYSVEVADGGIRGSVASEDGESAAGSGIPIASNGPDNGAR